MIEEFAEGAIRHLFTPSTAPELAEYYFAWICIFLVVNVVWDIITDKTANFHLTKLKHKTEVLHPAASFCSSMLLLIAVFKPEMWELAKESYIPVIIAGGSGILNTIPSLCPYET